MTHDVTVGEFFQNGFILAGLLGIVGFGLANVFNTSLQMLVQIAIPARSALQVRLLKTEQQSPSRGGVGWGGGVTGEHNPGSVKGAGKMKTTNTRSPFS